MDRCVTFNINDVACMYSIYECVCVYVCICVCVCVCVCVSVCVCEGWRDGLYHVFYNWGRMMLASQMYSLMYTDMQKSNLAMY